MQEHCSSIDIQHISLEETGYFSKLLIDYLNGDAFLDDKYNFKPSIDGIKAAINSRKNHHVNRVALVQALMQQYSVLGCEQDIATQLNILQDENTFTICTAHQPNLATGYAYFIYKIMHTVVLCNLLKQELTAYNFVPVFYIGSEDDDLDELGVFKFGEHEFRWNTQQTGAVGRMRTEDLQALLNDFFNVIGPPNENTVYLKDLLAKAYSKEHTIAQATQYLVHQLFGKYGVIALNPDDANLKRLFSTIISKELFDPKAFELVENTNKVLNEKYKTQAHARNINLFYIKDNLRARIEYDTLANVWKVVHTSIQWTEKELKEEVETCPERFSPNVILRGLYQETILPNVAFIGGGSEVAYWLQLKSVFDFYKVYYPTLIPRQSIQFLYPEDQKLLDKLNIDFKEACRPTEVLVKEMVKSLTQNDLSVSDEWNAINTSLTSIKTKADKIDHNLTQSVEAALKKIKYQLDIVEKKMYKAEKRNLSTSINRIYKAKEQLFPHNHLQERYYTFMPEYIKLGDGYFDIIQKAILPFGEKFAVINI